MDEHDLSPAQQRCLAALRTSGTLSERTLRLALGVHPLTIRSLYRRKLIRRGTLRTTFKTWEVIR